jgi:hypothetical protein
MGDVLERCFQAVEENREDLTRWQVLGDALLERGDVRGELLVAQLRFEGRGLPLWLGRSTRELQELLVTHRRALLGDLAALDERLLSTALRLTWRSGFIEQVGVASWLAAERRLEPAELLAGVMECPAGRLLDRLEVGVGEALPPTRVLEVAQVHLRSHPRAVTLRGPGEVDVTQLSTVFPALQELRLEHTRPIGALDLVRRGLQGLGFAHLDAVHALLLIDGVPLPALRQLDLQSLHTTNDDVEALLSVERWPRLTELAVHVQDADSLLAALARTGLAPQLERLVVEGAFSRETVQWLLAERRTFGKLKAMELRGHLERAAQWPKSERTREGERVPGLKVFPR